MANILKIEEGMKTIGDEAYAGTDITELVLPASLETIGAAAFLDCTQLTKVTVPKDSCLKTIGEGAFANCEALKEFRFPNSLKQIGEMAFFHTGLKEAVLPETAETIGDLAFWDCAGLRHVEVPNRNTMLGKDVFGSCPNLRTGHLACGFGKPETLGSILYTVLLWCTDPDSYDKEISEYAVSYFLAHQEQIMDILVKEERKEALQGILNSQQEEIKKAVNEHAAEYIALCRNGRGIAQLLLEASALYEKKNDDPFEL